MTFDLENPLTLIPWNNHTMSTIYRTFCSQVLRERSVTVTRTLHVSMYIHE